MVNVYIGIVVPPLSDVKPLMDEGTLIAAQVIVAPAVAELIITGDELDSLQIV